MTDSAAIRIACLGDTMPSGILHYETRPDFCSQRLLDELRKADLRIATLETAVGDEPTFDAGKMERDKDVIYCPTSDLRRLKELGINVVSLANNHAWDLGWPGIQHTFNELDRLGIKYCGAGRNLTQAQEPAVVNIKGKSIAFIAYCDDKPGTCGYVPRATDDSPGINVMIESNIHYNISRLKDKYDYLFVMMHWGKEYYYYPLPEVNQLAVKMIDWGADAIIGSHSHQIQPTVFHNKKPIIFSLGNFFFPDRIITAPRSTYYPTAIDNLDTLPKTLGYPFVDQPTYKIWKPVARTGQVVSLTLRNGSIRADRIFTHIDRESHIDISDITGPFLFRLAHKLVRLPFYGTLFFVMRGCRFIRKKIKGEL